MNKILAVILFVAIAALAVFLFLNYRDSVMENQPLFSGTKDISFETVSSAEDSKEINYKTIIVYPQFSGIEPGRQNKINNNIKEAVLDVTDKFKEDAKDLCDFSDLGDNAPGWQCEFTASFNNYQIIREKILSVEMEYYRFMGGAHGGTTFAFYNYNLETGEVLAWQDIFKQNSDYLKAISEYSFSNLKAQLLQGEYPLSQEGWIKEGTDANVDNYNTNIGFSVNGLKIIFQQYQVAPYAAGPQTVTIPYSELNNYINPSGLLGVR